MVCRRSLVIGAGALGTTAVVVGALVGGAGVAMAAGVFGGKPDPRQLTQSGMTKFRKVGTWVGGTME